MPRSSASASWSPRSRPSGPTTRRSWPPWRRSRRPSAPCCVARQAAAEAGGRRSTGRAPAPGDQDHGPPDGGRRRRRPSPSRLPQPAPATEAARRAARVDPGAAAGHRPRTTPAAVRRLTSPSSLATRSRATRSSRPTAGGSTPSSASASCTRASTSAAPTNTPIHAAAAGHHSSGPVPAMATATPSIIDHGSAGRDALRPPVGDRRDRRAVGGRRATSSATSARPGWRPARICHFEVRVGGNTYDPLAYVQPDLTDQLRWRPGRAAYGAARGLHPDRLRGRRPGRHHHPRPPRAAQRLHPHDDVRSSSTPSIESTPMTTCEPSW